MKEQRAATAPANTTDAAPTWGALLPLCLVAFAGQVHVNTIGPLAVAMARDLGVSIPLVGQVSTMIAAATALVGLVVGPLADHLGYRRVILAGLGLLAASAVDMGLAPAYPVLLAGGLLSGIGATVLGLVFAAAARYRGDGRRVALSRVQSVQTSGSILGAPALTALAATFSWRWGYAVVLVAYLAAIALIARALPPDPRPAGRFTPRATLVAYRPLLGDRRMLALYAANALRQLGWTGPFLYVGAFFTERHGLTLQQVGLAYMVASAGMLAGNAAAGRWLAGRDLRRAFASTVALLALAWLAVFALPLPAALCVAATAVAACASGFSWIAMTTLLATETPAGLGTTMALNNTAAATGAAAGGAAIGALIGLGGYTLLGVMLLAPTLAAAAFTWHPRLRAPRPAPEMS